MIGCFRIGQGMAGAGDAEHSQLRNSGGYREQLSRRLLRSELVTTNIRTRFIGAVVLTIAVVALNIASRRDRDMDASVMMMNFFAIAGMSPNFVPDFERQIALWQPVTHSSLAILRRAPGTLIIGDAPHPAAILSIFDMFSASGNSVHIQFSTKCAHGDRPERPQNEN